MSLLDNYVNSKTKKTQENSLVSNYKRLRAKQTLGFQPDKDAVDTISKWYQSEWEYDLSDPQDVSRKDQGLMPKRLEKQYNLDDAVDSYLYENNLPYASALPSVYQGYKTLKSENRKLQNQFNSLWRDAQPEFSKYLQDDYTVSDADAETVITTLLGSGKYDALKPYYSAANTDAGKAGAAGSGFTFTYKDFLKPYNQAAAEWKAEGQKKLAGTKAEIDKLQAELDTQMGEREKAVMILSMAGGNESGNQAVVAAQQLMDEFKDKNNRLSELQAQYRLANDQQALNQFAVYLDAPDFQKYATLGRNLKDANPRTIKNKVVYAKENYDKLALASMDFNAPEEVKYLPYYYMTDDEFALYNYLLAKKGDAVADDFLNHLTETLNYRMGNKQAENIEEMAPGLGRVAATALYGTFAGLDQAGTGAKQLFSEEALPTSALQYGSAAVRENLADDGAKLPDWLGGGSLAQTAYDAVTTVSNMAPSLMLSYFTGGLGAPAALAQGVGAATLGLSAGGNAYNQALKIGYTKEQAWNYGALIAASEGALQYFLGGIGKLGGKITGKGINALIKNIDNAFLKVSAEIGLKGFGEGFEEYLQDILDPVFRNIAYDEENDFKIWTPQATYSFILGALTAGLLEGPSSISNTVNAVQLGNAVIKDGKLDLLVQNALNLDPNTEAYQLASQFQDGKLNRNNSNAGELLVTYSEADGDLSFLTELPVKDGVTGIVREKIQARFKAEFEKAKLRAEFRTDIKAAALDPQTTRATFRVYNKLIKGESAGKSMAAELQASLRSAAAQKAELNADINVARTEAIIRLRPLYTVMQRAAQTGDFAAFQTAKEQYVQSFALEQAKHQAVKVRAQNRINAIDSDIKNKISELETTIKARSPVTAVGNGLNTAAAETEGRVTAVGNAVQNEAQGQFAASTVARNSDILNSEGIGSEQGSAEGIGGVDRSGDIPVLKTSKDYYDYVKEITKRSDFGLGEKVQHIQDTYNRLEDKTDVNCPSDTKFVIGFDQNGYIIYSWPKFLGFIKESIKSISRNDPLPRIWDRTGSLKGSNFTRIRDNGKSYSMDERSLPYVENPAAYHNGTFNTEVYFDVIDAIRNGNLDAFNAIRRSLKLPELSDSELSYYKGKYDHYVEKVKREIGEIDAIYGLKGYAAPWLIDGKVVLQGGAEQILTPFTGQILEELGLLSDLSRSK